MRVIEVRSGPNRPVVAWETHCSSCGTPVRFEKISSGFPGKNQAGSKPDENARCWDCWQAATRRYEAERAASRD